MDVTVEPQEAVKELVIMRGLPWCGKSYEAKKIAGTTGLIFSTDEYWYVVNHPEKPEEYSFNRQFLPGAHKWNQQRTFRHIEMGSPLIVVDNTNTTAEEALPYVEYAVWQDYKIRIAEPTSDRWLEIRELLKSKKSNRQKLKDWSFRLEEGSKETHSVPQFAIERMMWRWQSDLTVEEILASKSKGDRK